MRLSNIRNVATHHLKIVREHMPGKHVPPGIIQILMAQTENGSGGGRNEFITSTDQIEVVNDMLHAIEQRFITRGFVFF